MGCLGPLLVAVWASLSTTIEVSGLYQFKKIKNKKHRKSNGFCFHGTGFLLWRRSISCLIWSAWLTASRPTWNWFSKHTIKLPHDPCDAREHGQNIMRKNIKIYTIKWLLRNYMSNLSRIYKISYKSFINWDEDQYHQSPHHEIDRCTRKQPLRTLPCSCTMQAGKERSIDSDEKLIIETNPQKIVNPITFVGEVWRCLTTTNHG